MQLSDHACETGSNQPTRLPRATALMWIARLCAVKGGYATATLIAVFAGSWWGWVIPKHDVDARFLLSGVITVVGFCVCAVKIPRGSKTFYLFGVVLNCTSVGVVAVRGALGPVGIVALTLSVIMLILMALPMSWRVALAGVSSCVRPVELVAPLLVGAVILPPMLIVGGESGAERDGLLLGPPTDVGSSSSDLNEYLEQSGADRGCVMGKLFFEFGASTLSSWDDTAPSAEEIERIQKLAREC